MFDLEKHEAFGGSGLQHQADTLLEVVLTHLGMELRRVIHGSVLDAQNQVMGLDAGFLLVPFLLLVYPTEAPEVITSISLSPRFRVPSWVR